MTSPATDPEMTSPPTTRSAAGLTPDIPLPPPDWDLSPHTGLTRAHWVGVADTLLDSVARYRSPQGSRIFLPGRPSGNGQQIDGLEGFARTFLLAAFRYVGAPGATTSAHLARYLEGLVSGTQRVGADHGESWPEIGDHGPHGQSHVEAASIALSLHLTRSATWDELSSNQQDRLDSWLRNALKREPSPNNWYLFPLTIASFLEGVGRPDDVTTMVIDRGLSLIDQWYRGDGWYSDGEGAAFDHYIGWALHFYPLLHARLRQETDLEARLGRRLASFLDTFALTFDQDGAPLYQGRSLTYRMATVASIAMGEVLGHTPLSHGQSRRVMSASLRYFLQRGATRDGILTLGWHGPHEATLQRYSGPGSPYWASKGFAALMLASDHPVWTDQESALRTEGTNLVKVIAPAGWLVQRTADGLVRVHNHGSDQIKPHEADSGAPDPLYSRFGYSTRTGPTALHNPSDNDIQLEVRGVWSVRRRIHAVATGEDWVASWHAPRFPAYAPRVASGSATAGPILPSGRIDSVTVARGPIEVRIHRLLNAPPNSRIRVAGWAVSAQRPENLATHSEGLAAAVSREGDEPLYSRVIGLLGLDRADVEIVPRGTAFGPWAALPMVTGRTGPRHALHHLVVAASALTTEPLATEEYPRVTVDDTVVHIDWCDGLPTEIDLEAIDWTRAGALWIDAPRD